MSAQSDSVTGKFHFSGYGEFYISGNIPGSGTHRGLPFIYNFSRNEELTANLLLGRINFDDKDFRVNLGVMAGTYPQTNLAAEPCWAREIYEVNAGVKLSKKENLWLDAGIMPSHIGWESAIGEDNFLLTRSIIAENSPYYETGVKISYTDKTGKLSAAALVLNGWQKISRPEGMHRPSYGMQTTYKPTAKLTLNYSNFLGSDAPDAQHVFRAYHDFYGQYSFNDKISTIFGFDYGTDYERDGNRNWCSFVGMARWEIATQHAASLRYEYFCDPRGVMVNSEGVSGGKITGLAADYDFKVNRHGLFRFELKHYRADRPLFYSRKFATVPTASFCVKF